MNWLFDVDVLEISILSKDAAPAVPDALVALRKNDAPTGDAVALAKAFAGEKADAEDKLEALAKAHAAAHVLPLAMAYDAVLKTAEGRALYASASAAHGGYQRAVGARTR